jgi:uncharacterized protein DUF5753/helix-turn-helix protein
MLIGARLRQLRIDKGLTREAAGGAIRASEWKIHRLENGQVGFKDRDVMDLLAFYGVTDPEEVATIVTLAREANAPGWWHSYGDVLPPWFRAYVDLEAAATLIRTYEGQLVPGLLQTEEYAQALMRGALLDASPEETERRITLRMRRQEVLTRPDGPRLWAVVDEAALRRPVGGPKVMHAQIEWLIEASRLPGVTVQVLPFNAGAHPAMVGGFSILRFADRELPDVVYFEHLSNAVYLDKRDDVDQYLHVMDQISARSQLRDRTVQFLTAMLGED